MERPEDNREAHRVTQSELLTAPSDADLSQIRGIEAATFDWAASEEELDALESKIKDAATITAVIRNREHAIVGHVVGIPSMHVDAAVLAHDPDLRASADTLYIETLAIAKPYQGDLDQLMQLFSTLMDGARQRGYATLSAHVPVRHYPMYKRGGNAVNIRTLPNWFNSGEDHYYIEMPLQQDGA